MKLKLKNDAGAVREVTAGLSWWGGLFTGFYLMHKGLLGKGLLFLAVAYAFQAMLIIPACAIAVDGGPEKAHQFLTMMTVPFLVPNVIFLFKSNKWIVRHFLDRGYKPIGPGWEQWGPRYGVEVN